MLLAMSMPVISGMRRQYISTLSNHDQRKN